MIDIEKRKIALNFNHSFRQNHPSYEPLVIRFIEEVGGSKPGIRFGLTSRWPEFSHFLLAVDEEDFVASEAGMIEARFGTGSDDKRMFRVKAVSSSGHVSEEYLIEVGFVPARDPETGVERFCNNRFRLRMSPFIQPDAGSPEDWKYPVATAAERTFAFAKWGAQVERLDSDYAKAKELARILMRDLWPHSGRPSEAMKTLSPFEQYRRMTAGDDKGFCVNFAAIFECACKCFDILTRHIAVCEAPIATHSSLLLVGTNHATTEVFDRGTGCWILMDLRLYMLGAYIGEEGPLSLAEFILFLNQPARRARLHLQVFDIENDTEQFLPLDACPRKEFDCYMGWGRQLEYSRI